MKPTYQNSWGGDSGGNRYCMGKRRALENASLTLSVLRENNVSVNESLDVCQLYLNEKKKELKKPRMSIKKMLWEGNTLRSRQAHGNKRYIFSGRFGR